MDDSLLDDSVFDVGASSDFEPVKAKPKPKAAVKKVIAAKPKKTAAKPKAAPKKRAKKDSDAENSGDDDHDTLNDASLLSNTPPIKVKKVAAPKKAGGKPLKENPNESFDISMVGEDVAVGKAPDDASAKYQMISHIEHILIRPDTYIGSVERTKQEMWVYNSENESIEFRTVDFVPGLYKIFDEILVNAADNKQNDKNMNEIRVTVDRESGEISVWNNGKGIPIEIHKEKGIYIPEMIFGNLLTSSNYNDNQAKITGGRNGYGAKLCNVFSVEFSIETVDSKRKKKYKQTWTQNMSVKGKAKITDFSGGDDYTKVTFRPDYTKFSMEGMDDDFEALVKRRVHDMAGTCKGVKVKLNGERIKIKNFKDYMAMYTKSIKAEQGGGDEGPAEDTKQVIIIDTPSERWQIGFAVSDGSFKQVSFVNSIATTSGGTHVKHVSDQIITKLLEQVKKQNKKGVVLKNHQILQHLFLFVNCLIVNPAFTSQTKEQLTTKVSQFGSKCVVSDNFLKQILKTDVMTNIMNFAEKKNDQLLAKSDGSRRARMNNSKLTDANKAGTKDGWQCTLILTEGDSASGLALAGRAVVDPDRIGVFPLRGKLLNVRDASVQQIANNQEIQNIKKFMGLQHKKEYTDTKSLRYGHLMIMTDQDHDGSHIKGLLINFFETQFPSLLKIEDFLNVFITPIVKVWKGDPKHPSKELKFYTMPEYEAWRLLPGNSTWEHKYYKGLGTSSTEDAEIYFKDLDRHLKEFEPMKKEEAEMIDLAFSKKKADARKNWLRDFIPGTFLDMRPKNISYDDFVNKELILFSMADNLRSIPSVVDGFKPSQRKVLYTCFKKNVKKDMKVVELAGMVSGLTAYSYGETSMQQTIVGLAQTYVGSNNINCLEPSGNFGSRRLGGGDAASARYIYTRLSPFARKIFNPADEALLTYHLDDGKHIEPHNYVPVLPLILLNGADGIGTGWSTSIPNYRPEDIVHNLRLRMNGSSKEDMLPMSPWFRGFTGAVEDMGGDRWKFTGIIKQTSDSEVEITELPVRLWTQDFKDKLEEIIKAEKVPSFVKDYTEYNTPTKVHFIIKMEDKHMKNALEKGLEETFKLTKTQATSNLVAFDGQGRIHRYETVLDIMEEFYHIRLQFYEKRKQHLLDCMQRDLDRLSNQARFVKMIIDGDLVVSKKKKSVLVSELKRLNFKPFPKVSDASKGGETEDIVENDDEGGEDSVTKAGASDFDYLLGMAIWSLTLERVEKLLAQIGDKEMEIDALIKLSPKDLWNSDLDDFLAVWNAELDDEKKRAKKIRGIGRRASAKLGIGAKPSKRKRKGGDDSDDMSDDDFVVAKKKPAIKSVMDRVKNKESSTLLSYFNNPAPAPKTKPKSKVPAVVPAPKPTTNDEDFMDIDDVVSDAKSGADIQPLAVKKRGKLVAAQSKVPVKPPAPASPSDIDMSEDEMFAAMEKAAESRKVSDPPARQPRAAAKKVAKYVLDDSEESDSDSNGDDMLGDVSMMVKGIGSGENPGSGSRPLFSNTAGRPTSSHGLPRSISKPKPIVDLGDDSDEMDQTDYKSLIPQGSPMRPAARRAGEVIGSDEDEDMEDSFNMPPPKAKPVTKSKPVVKAKVVAPAAKSKLVKTKAPPKAPVPKKAVALSPAAKAYAAKQEKAKALAAKTAPKKASKKSAESDAEEDGDDLVNDILSDEEEDVPAPRGRAAAARPGRRVVAAKKKYAFSDESEEASEQDESFDVDESD